MKKRFISVLLTLCMVLAMIPCLTITASAADTITYTLKAGDTVLKVCQANGINFYANMEWIKRANNITDFTKLPVGKVLTLPAAGTTPSLNDLPGSSSGSSTGSNTGSSTGSTSTGTTGSTGGVANGTLLEGDYVQEYLIYHVMVSGDTVGALCNRYGVDFASNADRIMKLNNIKSWNRIAVGKTLLLPCTSLPSSGNCIRVIAHRVVRGDTAIGICNSYGVTYASVMSLMQALNNRTNLNAIQAGQTLLVPVPSVITNGQVGGTNTGNNGNTGSTGDSGSTSSGTKYTVNKNSVNSNYGSYAISSLSAAAGTTITVRVSPKTNYALGSVSVRNDSDGSSIAVTYNGNDATFKMPESNVTVSVNFVASTQYTISRDKTTNGSFATHVNGKAVDKAMAGQTVQIVATPAANYEIDKITYVYNNESYSADANDSFVMPEGNVLVKVSFKRMAEYAIDPTNQTSKGGSYTVTRNGSTVTKAMSGDTIKINPVPSSGYSVSGVKVVGTDNGVTVPVTESSGVYSFVMPRYAVTITVNFDNRSYSITTNVGANGGYTVTVQDDNGSTKATAQARNGQSVVSANVGDKVSLAITHNDGYDVDTVVVTQADGSSVPNFSGSGDAYTFTMPASNVTVKVTFTTKPYEVTAKLYGTGNDYKVSVGGSTVDAADGNGATINANLGDTVTVTLNDKPWKDGYKINSVMLTKTSNNTAISGLVRISDDGRSATFNMPAYDVTVQVVCDAKPLTITTKIAGTGGGYTVTVGENKPVKASDGGTVPATVGQQIAIGAVDQKEGYGVIKTEVKTASGKDVENNWGFQMPAENVTVTVTFGPLSYNAVFKGSSSTDTFNVTVGSAEAKKVQGTAGTELTVKTADKVTISGLMADQGWVIDKVVVDGVKDPYVSSGNNNSVTFNMPAKGESSVTVTVTFKQKA